MRKALRSVRFSLRRSKHVSGIACVSRSHQVSQEAPPLKLISNLSLFFCLGTLSFNYTWETLTQPRTSASGIM